MKRIMWRMFKLWLLLSLCSVAQDRPNFQSSVVLVYVDADVRHDGQPLVFFGHDQAPLDVILLLDGRDPLRDAIHHAADTARQALSSLHEGDRVAVMAFTDYAGRTCPDLLVDFTNDVDAVARSIANPTLKHTARYFHCPIPSALAGAGQRLAPQSAGNRRRAIIAITDDKDIPIRPEAVRRALPDLWTADAIVPGVVVPSEDRIISIGPPYRGAKYFAGRTGGEVLTDTGAAEALQETLRRLRSRYSLYYAMPPGKPGVERKIEVKLPGHPRAVILARPAYITH